MKVDEVTSNNRRKAFEIRAGARRLIMPYSRLVLQPTPTNRVVRAYADPELGREAFTYILENGEEDTVHLDAVMDYNSDPDYLAELFVYQLTVEAQRALDETDLSTREVIRRVGTSASQFYRLLDTTNYRKSIGQMLALLSVLDRDVELQIKPRRAIAARTTKRKRTRRKTA